METLEVVTRRTGPRGRNSSSGRGIRGSLALVAWLAGLAVAVAFFHALGSGTLAAPPARPAAWGAWLEGRDPLVAAVAVLRLVVLGLGWYLLTATLLGIVARLLRAVRLIAITDAVTIPTVRRLLRDAVGVSLATAMIATAPVAAGQASHADAASPANALDVSPVDVRAGPASDDGERPEPGAQALPLPLELTADPGRAEALPPAGSAVADDAPASGGGPGSVTDRQRSVTVAPGDSLWSIAHRAVAATNGGELSETSVAAYWTELVERNRSSLHDPANPDLIFPDETVVLPDLPNGVAADR